MRVLLITVRADFGGGPKHVNDLINHMPPEFELYVACPKDKPFYDHWNKNQKVKEILCIPFRRFSVSSYIKLAVFIKKNKIDVIHSHGRGAGIYSRMLKLLLPHVRIIHTMHGFHFQDYKPFEKHASSLIEKAFSHLTERVIAVSNGEKANMTAFNIWDEKKIKVIYNGVEKPEKIDGTEKLREKLELPADKFIITSIVRFNFHKNIKMTLEIAERLKNSGDVLFVIVGDGEEFSAMKELKERKNLDNVIFPGFKENALEYIRASDVYLSTSIREGMPLSVIEACMLGVPMLASDVTGNNEIVLHGGNGYLFPLNDVQAPVGYIKKLKADRNLLEQMSKKAGEIYKQKFTVEKMTRNIAELYKPDIK